MASDGAYETWQPSATHGSGQDPVLGGQRRHCCDHWHHLNEVCGLAASVVPVNQSVLAGTHYKI